MKKPKIKSIGYGFYCIIMIKSLNHPYMLMAMAIVCIHSVMEHHMFEVYYDVFLMLPLAKFDVKDIGKRQRKCGN